MFIRRRASPPKRASPLWRDPTTMIIPLIKTFCFFMVRGLALLGEISPLTARDLAFDCPRSRLGGLKIFRINTTKRASPSRRARQFGANALFNTYSNPEQKEVVTGVKMSGRLASASPPDNLPC